MGIKIYKPYTPSTRNRSILDFSFLSKKNQKNHYLLPIIEQKDGIIKEKLPFVIKEVVISVVIV
jgi:hypothetical protein